MTKKLKVKTLRYSFPAILVSFLLILSSGCSIPTEDETEMLEDFLSKLGAVEGEITFTTKDGETVNIKVTKDSVDKKDSSYIKEESPEDKNTGSTDLSEILPSLNSKEDVFKLLGVWEEAHALLEQGLTWSHTAEEVGYNCDTMYAGVVEIGERELHDAKVEGLNSYDQYASKLDYFSQLAEKWIKKIFADAAPPADTADTVADLAGILPPPDSFEDVFAYLGILEDALALRELGITWSHTAGELDYNADKMYSELRELAERELHDAKVDGLISYEQYQSMLAEFSETAMGWVQEIFADTGTADVQ
jgi:hypothetical protein